MANKAHLLDFSFTWIYTAETVKSYCIQLDKFFSLYQHTDVFPHPEVREDPVVIIQRILQNNASPKTFILMLEDVTTNKIVGGCVLEFYPESCCFLLTYIFIHPLYRGKGIGYAIFHDERGIHQIVKQLNISAFALFSEVTDPKKSSINDSVTPLQRALFFKSVGGKKVDINYQSPPLNTLNHKLDNLMLITFPEICPLSNPFSAIIFNKFYNEFCASLNAKPSFQNSEPIFLLPII